MIARRSATSCSLGEPRELVVAATQDAQEIFHMSALGLTLRREARRAEWSSPEEAGTGYRSQAGEALFTCIAVNAAVHSC